MEVKFHLRKATKGYRGFYNVIIISKLSWPFHIKGKK